MNRAWVMYRWVMGILVACGFGSAVNANQVRVFREGALVRIVGDNAGNQIAIVQNTLGDVVVTGRNGTLVNGLSSVRLVRANPEQMDVRMGGGNDVVTVSGLNLPVDLFVDLGAGADRLSSGTVPSRVGANVAIEGGVGNDVIRLAGWTIEGDLYIDGKAGILITELTAMQIGFHLTVIGDSYADRVTLAGCTTGDATSIETKGGADQVVVQDHGGYSLFVSTDLGSDSVMLEAVVVWEDIGIFTGGEGDAVEMYQVESGKNITVSLDTGNDLFSGTSVWAAFDAVFEGGDGLDSFQDNGVAGGEKTEIKEFELFP